MKLPASKPSRKSKGPGAADCDLKPAMGCDGDRFADRGMRFGLACCNQAVCTPSRNNLLTGSRSASLGVYDPGTYFRRAEPGAVRLPHYFIRHGWRAEGIGKVFHIGHGNHDDAGSWSVPFHSDKVIECLQPENSARGRLGDGR
jgi:iduronate 2-sulfatase